MYASHAAVAMSLGRSRRFVFGVVKTITRDGNLGVGFTVVVLHACYNDMCLISGSLAMGVYDPIAPCFGRRCATLVGATTMLSGPLPTVAGGGF